MLHAAGEVGRGQRRRRLLRQREELELAAFGAIIIAAIRPALPSLLVLAALVTAGTNGAEQPEQTKLRRAGRGELLLRRAIQSCGGPSSHSKIFLQRAAPLVAQEDQNPRLRLLFGWPDTLWRLSTTRRQRQQEGGPRADRRTVPFASSHTNLEQPTPWLAAHAQYLRPVAPSAPCCLLQSVGGVQLHSGADDICVPRPLRAPGPGRTMV